MAAHDDNNARRSNGVLSGQGVGIALAAIFVGVALAVAYIASDGALFAQPSSQLPADTGQKQGTANHTQSTSSEARVISRNALDKEPVNAVAKPSLQPQQQERTNTAASDTKQELLAIKNFPWSSVAGQYVKDSQARFASLKQLQPPLPEKEPLALPDSIPVNVEPKGKTSTIDNDDSIFDALGDTTNPIEIPPIEDEEDDDKESTQDQQNDNQDNDDNEQQTDNQQNDADNGDSDSGDSSNGEPSEGSDDNSSSGSTSDDNQSGESDNEVPPTNSTDSSSSNSTESSSTSEDDDSSDDIGIELNLPLG